MNIATAAWLLVASVGIISEFQRLHDARSTRAWMRANAINGQRLLVANYKVRNARIRGAVSTANLVLGLIAVFAVQSFVVAIIIPIILIFGQAALTLTSWLEQRDDNELARLARERKRRSADPH